MKSSIKFIFLSLSIALLTPFSCKADGVGYLDQAGAIVKQGSEALNRLSRDVVIDSLNGVSKAANNLVKNGVTLHFGPHKIIPQIGFCSIGILASACGLGVITYAALQNDQKDTKRKYLAGAGMLGLGIASLATSCLFSLKS